MTLENFIDEMKVEYNSITGVLFDKLKRYELTEPQNVNGNLVCDMELIDINYDCSAYLFGSGVYLSVDFSSNKDSMIESIIRNRPFLYRRIGRAKIYLQFLHKNFKMNDDKSISFPYDIFEDAVTPTLKNYGFNTNKYFKTHMLTAFEREVFYK